MWNQNWPEKEKDMDMEVATDNYLDNTVTAEKRPSDSNTTSKTAKKRKTTSYARGEGPVWGGAGV